MSKRWTAEDLAQRIADNPGLRISREPRRSKAPVSNSEVIARAMSEETLQENVRQMAVFHRWRFFHAWTSVHSPIGFPDCLLIRFTRENTCAGQKIYARLLVVELKREGKEPTPIQQEWLDDFQLFGELIARLMEDRRVPALNVSVSVESYCWKPTAWLSGEVEKVLI